jgi:hypothetical protein
MTDISASPPLRNYDAERAEAARLRRYAAAQKRFATMEAKYGVRGMGGNSMKLIRMVQTAWVKDGDGNMTRLSYAAGDGEWDND